MFSRRQHESGTFRATIGDSSARCFIPHPPPPPRCDSSLCLCIFHAPGKKRLSRIAPKKLSPPVPHLSRYNSHPMRTTLPHLLSAKSLPSISPRVTSSFLLSIFTSNTTHFSPPPLLFFISKCSGSLLVSRLPRAPPHHLSSFGYPQRSPL